jgi:GT2 family glycosyltransferase
VTGPSVSVVIVTWNHKPFLLDCLEAVLAQDYSPLDVTVVDNGSQDGSPEWVAGHYPAVRLRAFDENRGFAYAFNWGVRHTDGDLVLSLNPDTVARQRFVREMVGALERAESDGEPIGSVAPKLLSMADPAILDSTGLFIDRRRRPYDRGQGEVDRGQYDGQPLVFGACGAAALYRRLMLEDVALDGEYYDESFFAYYEDADLAWRAQLRGWGCAYAPGAVASHARGWGDTLRKRGHAIKDASGPRLALRNRYLMIVKNDALGHFLADLPLILGAEVPRLAYAALTRPGVLLGLVDLARALPAALRKRRAIRSRRTVDDSALRRWWDHEKTGQQVELRVG